jgi:excinuclease ABC subunit A
VSGQTAEKIVLELLKSPEGTRVNLMQSLLVNRKGEHRELIESARAQGFVRLRVNGEIQRLDEITTFDKRKKHTVELITDRLVIKPGVKDRLTDSVEQTLRMGNGVLLAQIGDTDRIFSEHLACTPCGISFPALTPQSFSFNSPQGMCLACNGLGTQVAFDPDLIIPDDQLSIREGALKPVGRIDADSRSISALFHRQMFEHLKIPMTKPFKKLTPGQRKTIFYGTGDKRYKINWGSHGTSNSRYEGLLNRLMRRFKNTRSEGMKRWYAQFLANTPCDICKGDRLREESAAVKVSNRSLIELSAMTIEEALDFFDKISLKGADAEIAQELLKEIKGRLGFLNAVGLSYLSLNRLGPTLSGGESQRIRLASQVGSELSGVIYILDEPSIGLHQRDNERLLNTLLKMRDIGNTVIVVEHDEDTIRAADHVIDFGPGAGTQGGGVIHAGTPKALLKNKKSLTGDYLAGRKTIPIREEPRTSKGYIEVSGA